MFIRESIRAIDSLKLKDADRRKVYFGNAMRMLRLDLPVPAIKQSKTAARAKRKK